MELDREGEAHLRSTIYKDAKISTKVQKFKNMKNF